MEGFSGVIHLKAENIIAEPFDSVEIEVEGDIPTKNKTFDFYLGNGESKQRRFQLRESKSRGPHAVAFKIMATEDSLCSVSLCRRSKPHSRNCSSGTIFGTQLA